MPLELSEFDLQHVARFAECGTIEDDNLDDDLLALKAIASEFFTGDVGVSVEEDPELAGVIQVVFHVIATGDIKEISQRQIEWYRRTTAILGDNCDKVRLSIHAEGV